ncbi:prephenate dehydrogenase [Propionibacterium australiense]|uniref:Prephenate dehydrogenase n=1 Tax=Propionibacterium australiense TaxID=119981 RepID=A0A383S404_9ACTN|nr:prephenate dehydrogenase [Propionibacterium australiense]RLP11568.1 prephenate dehydrogenase [Propionibacterium australiense]RLP12698.1 prephenate dehydrogenase [Propionibacterium australiense]SYZ32282.1 6-phosphogluconate dehydrogenase C-terminal domain-like [Propionibacterium australiense]VEH90521.1 Arogenate dehydrogenase [Propionibacterium australiense]
MAPKHPDAEALSPTVIIGTGLIGASIGCALTEAGVDVRLRDRYRSHAVVAAGVGAGSVEAPMATKVRLVVVAVPPAVVAPTVAQAIKHYRNATVTDVASVKQPILADLEAMGTDLRRYVGSHPMAGSELSGPLTARPRLFVDRTWVLAEGTGSAEAVETAEKLVGICGARLVRRAPADHDRAVAETSHVPQIMSSLTAARLADVPPEDLRLAGQGVRDVTRIANSDPALWRQIISGNRAEISTQLKAIRDDLDRLIAGLDDIKTIGELIARGRSGVAALPGKHGRPASTTLEHVTVEIPDAPGALARLFVDIMGQGVNVEDLSIEHGYDRDVGYLSITVEAEQAQDLREAMGEKGWTLRS